MNIIPFTTIFILGLISGLEKRTLPATIALVVFAISIDILRLNIPYASYISTDLQSAAIVFLIGYFIGAYWKKIAFSAGKAIASMKGLKIGKKLPSIIPRELKDLKTEKKLHNQLEKLTKSEEKEIKKEYKLIEALKKKVNSAIDWFEKGSKRKALKNIIDAVKIVESAQEMLIDLMKIQQKEIANLKKEEQIEQEEFRILENFGSFFSQIENKERNINIQEFRIERAIENLELKEQQDLRDMYNHLNSIKNILSRLYYAIKTNNIQMIGDLISKLRNELNILKLKYKEYLSILNEEKKLEKKLEKLMKEEEKIIKYKIKMLKKVHKLPRL